MTRLSPLHIAIPCHGRHALTSCALDALRRTTSVPYHAWVIDDSTVIERFRTSRVTPLVIRRTWTAGDGSAANGAALDAALAALPPEAEWLFTMHNDAAPLARSWLATLTSRLMGLGDIAVGFHDTPRGFPHPLGALYRVRCLRELQITFRSGYRGLDVYDVGERLEAQGPYSIVAPASRLRRPWWLRHADCAVDDSGQIVYAHLGGGTIGAMSRRIPWWLWPALVRRELRRRGL